MPTQIKVEALPRYCALDVGDTFEGFEVAATVPGSPHMVLDVPDGMDPRDALNALAQSGVIVDGRAAHEDYRPLWIPPDPIQALELAALFTIGDTFDLMGRDVAAQRGKWGAKRLGHADTYVDKSHWMLQGKTLVVGPGAGQDSQAHGTHTLTTAAGPEGFAPDAEMYTVNVLPGGSGSEAGVANGIRWLADQQCDVVTLSLGGSASQVIDDACTYARQRGCWLAAAAGNGGGAPIGSPTRAATVIVLACDRSLHYASFTDGRGWGNPNRITAPGVDIVAGFPGGTTGAASGTSMACPHAAGALLYLRAAGLTEGQMLAYLQGHQVGVS